MKGFVLMNAYPSGEKFYRQSNRIAEELKAQGVEVSVKKNGEVGVKITSDGVTAYGLNGEAFCVYLDKDKYLGQALEKAGLKLFNSAKSVEICDDKTLTFLYLEKSGLNIPKTIPAPLCYTKNAVVDEEYLQRIEKELAYPIVVKKSYGSFGDGVMLVKDREELKKAAQACLFVPHCYQQFISSSYGKDVRVIVVGGKALGGMLRRAKGEEFRSNIELGGEGIQIPLTEEFKRAAELAANVLGLDYCGVDLLYGEKGEPIVCEVNSNAFFEGFEKVTGMDVAIAYAEYILESMKK